MKKLTAWTAFFITVVMVAVYIFNLPIEAMYQMSAFLMIAGSSALLLYIGLAEQPLKEVSTDK